MTAFPSATILGYPRIGRNRELKRATEAFWAGRIDAAALTDAARAVRLATYARLADLGLDAGSAAIPESFSFYDQVLDASFTLGALPPRFAGLTGLDLYFTAARGAGQVAPLEMTKWFDTNYHYLVPEIGPNTPVRYTARTAVELFTEAREAGYTTRPVLVGTVTYLLLAKASDDAPAGFRPLDRLGDVVAAYAELLADAAAAGAPWIQLDEPALVSDNVPASQQEIADAIGAAYRALTGSPRRPQILVTTPYGDAGPLLSALAATDVEAIHLDLVRGGVPTHAVAGLAGKTLVAGVVDGRNVWRCDLADVLGVLQSVRTTCGGAVAVATSTSLQHVPHDTADEHWTDPELDTALHSWLAFADQKVTEVATLARGLTSGLDAVAESLADATAALTSRATASGVTVPAVRARTAALHDADFQRVPYAQRAAAQAARLHLPDLPTTTIGSFPQTADIRRARAAHDRGELSDAAYRDAMCAEIRRVIELQETIGLDVLVHGEPERNDMVQYFAELLDGFAVTRNGWVQSYGTRCTRPSILWGDVARPEPMTVEWATYAQSLTAKPVKGMLTGPVTIMAWSFVRDDIPLGETANQIALALRDEIGDLQAAGIGVIQVDEPALRELLPLRLADQPAYLDWAVGAFRLATSGVDPATQIHTHLCYSEFGEVIGAIDALNADVTSLEAACSRMEIVPQLASVGFARGIGPGIYDIHSPRIPSQEELTDLLELAAGGVPGGLLWVNPDCGLKTRAYQETIPALEHLVAAAHAVRAGRAAAPQDAPLPDPLA